jgi:hypothetical protein
VGIDSASLFVHRDSASLISQWTDNLSKLSAVFSFDRELFVSKVYERAIRGSVKKALRRQQGDTQARMRSQAIDREYDSGKPTSAPARALISQDHRDAQAEQEFLTFASRHGSEVSSSSDSEGIISIAAPQNLFPVHHNGEEEVWSDYDELLNRVTSAVGRRHGYVRYSRHEVR